MVAKAPKRRFGWLFAIVPHLLATGVGFRFVWAFLDPYVPDLPLPDVSIPDSVISGSVIACLLLLLAFVLRGIGPKVIGCAGFAAAAFSLGLPWIEAGGTYGSDVGSGQLDGVVVAATVTGFVLLVLGKSLSAAKWSVGAAALTLAVGLYVLYDPQAAQDGFSSGRVVLHPAYGVYVEIAGAAVALATTLIWLVVKYAQRPPPPVTFPKIREQFPRL